MLTSIIIHDLKLKSDIIYCTRIRYNLTMSVFLTDMDIAAVKKLVVSLGNLPTARTAVGLGLPETGRVPG